MEKALELRADFCKEIAQTTLDGNERDAIQQRRADAATTSIPGCHRNTHHGSHLILT
jgi:hypothetical protein